MNTFKKIWLALTVVVGIYAIVWGYNRSYDRGFYEGLDAAGDAYDNFIAGNCSCRAQ